MTTWFRIAAYSFKITPVEVERATDHFLWVSNQYGKTPRRASIRSSNEQYYKTRYEATQALIERAEQDLNGYQYQVFELTGILADLKKGQP
jgi:hypothetical protein